MYSLVKSKQRIETYLEDRAYLCLPSQTGALRPLSSAERLFFDLAVRGPAVGYVSQSS